VRQAPAWSPNASSSSKAAWSARKCAVGLCPVGLRDLVFAASLVAASCNNVVPPPGDVTLGTFAFTAMRQDDQCHLTDPDAGVIAFVATLTGQGSTGAAFLSRGAAVETGVFQSFDGGPGFTVCGTADRTFPDAGGQAVMTEAISGLIYPTALALCPADPGLPRPADDCETILDGGSPGTAGPLPVGDAGVRAILVCGRMVDVVEFMDNSGDGPCTINYVLTGTRQ
jgi:hypothetical protein